MKGLCPRHWPPENILEDLYADIFSFNSQNIHSIFDRYVLQITKPLLYPKLYYHVGDNKEPAYADLSTEPEINLTHLITAVP